jgi:hypothetical protein
VPAGWVSEGVEGVGEANKGRRGEGGDTRVQADTNNCPPCCTHAPVCCLCARVQAQGPLGGCGQHGSQGAITRPGCLLRCVCVCVRVCVCVGGGAWLSSSSQGEWLSPSSQAVLRGVKINAALRWA